jgi:hypothetical protein
LAGVLARKRQGWRPVVVRRCRRSHAVPAPKRAGEIALRDLTRVGVAVGQSKSNPTPPRSLLFEICGHSHGGASEDRRALLDKVGVSRDGTMFVVSDLLGNRLSLLEVGVSAPVELGTVRASTRDRIDNMTATRDGEVVVIGATVAEGPARRRILIGEHDGTRPSEWQLVCTRSAYATPIALGRFGDRAALAVGDQRHTEVFFLAGSRLSEDPSLTIPLPASALGFTDAGEILIGTEQGLVCVRDA